MQSIIFAIIVIISIAGSGTSKSLNEMVDPKGCFCVTWNQSNCNGRRSITDIADPKGCFCVTWNQSNCNGKRDLEFY